MLYFQYKVSSPSGNNFSAYTLVLSDMHEKLVLYVFSNKTLYVLLFFAKLDRAEAYLVHGRVLYVANKFVFNMEHMHIVLCKIKL